jgi:hypothetical protein
MTTTSTSAVPDSYESCQAIITKALASDDVKTLKDALTSVDQFFTTRANKKKRESTVNGEGAFKKLMDASPSYARFKPAPVSPTPSTP